MFCNSLVDNVELDVEALLHLQHSVWPSAMTILNYRIIFSGHTNGEMFVGFWFIVLGARFQNCLNCK